MTKRYLMAVLVMSGSLSAKPAAAQFPLELGFGTDVSLALMRSRAFGFPVRADNRGSVSVEGAYGYSAYLSTLPYEGWGGRAEVSGGWRGDPGSYLGDELQRGGDLYGRGRLEVLYVTPGWTVLGFGASLARIGTSYLDYGGTGNYYIVGNLDIAGLHVSWSQLSRWYTVTFRADLTAVAGWGRSHVQDGIRAANGQYGEWALGPSVQLSVPFNRALWVRGLRKERVVYSPRT